MRTGWGDGKGAWGCTQWGAADPLQALLATFTTHQLLATWDRTGPPWPQDPTPKGPPPTPPAQRHPLPKPPPPAQLRCSKEIKKNNNKKAQSNGFLMGSIFFFFLVCVFFAFFFLQLVKIIIINQTSRHPEGCTGSPNFRGSTSKSLLLSSYGERGVAGDPPKKRQKGFNDPARSC